MSDIKSRVKSINPNVKAMDMKKLNHKTVNVYESIAIIRDRAKRLNKAIKIELHKKLEDFEENVDTLEEFLENKEQMQISKFYEKLPHPSVIALHEYLNEEIDIYRADPREKD